MESIKAKDSNGATAMDNLNQIGPPLSLLVNYYKLEQIERQLNEEEPKSPNFCANEISKTD